MKKLFENTYNKLKGLFLIESYIYYYVWWLPFFLNKALDGEVYRKQLRRYDPANREEIVDLNN